MVRACGSYPQCPGFNSLYRHVSKAFLRNQRSLFLFEIKASGLYLLAPSYGFYIILKFLKACFIFNLFLLLSVFFIFGFGFF